MVARASKTKSVVDFVVMGHCEVMGKTGPPRHTQARGLAER